MYCSQTSLENSEIDSGSRSTSSLNLLGLALKRYKNFKLLIEIIYSNFSGLHKANKRLSRAFSFSPEPNKHLLKKINSPSHLLQDEWSNSFDSIKRMSAPSREVSVYDSEMNSSNSVLGFIHGIVRFFSIYAIYPRT
jgi:hypothetical protein